MGPQGFLLTSQLRWIFIESNPGSDFFAPCFVRWTIWGQGLSHHLYFQVPNLQHTDPDPKKKHNVYGLGILSNYLYIQFGWKSCEKLIQHQPIHHKIVSSRSDWTLYVFLHISHENDSNFSKDGISLPALPDERFHFTKAGKHPEKTITLGYAEEIFPRTTDTFFWNFLCADRNLWYSAPNRYLLSSLALERILKTPTAQLCSNQLVSVCQSATMFLRKFQQTRRTYPQVPIKIDMSRENESCLPTLALHFPKGQLRKSTLPPIMVQCGARVYLWDDRFRPFSAEPWIMGKRVNPLTFSIDT